jgi:hypothetical protein
MKLVALSMLIAATGAHAAPLVFSLDTTKDGCAATVRDLAAAKDAPARVLFTSKAKECPREVLLGKVFIAVEGASVKAYALDGKVTELAKLPAEDASVWVEEGGKVRAAWLVVDGVTLSAKGDVVTFEGKTFKVGGDDAAAFPPWGTPAMAILAELEGAGATAKWKRIEAKPTKTDAGDTPGIGALSTRKAMKKGVLSIGELVAKMTCVGGVLECDAQGAAAKKLVGATDDVMLGTLPLNKSKGALVVFAVMFGDTPHAFAPVYLCSDGASSCKSSVIVEKKSAEQRQLGLSTQGGFAIVSEEYSSANAHVVDASGKVVLSLPQSRAVVFLPDGFSLP